MGFSKAVISTEVGAEGIDGEGSAYLVARSKEEYVDRLGRLLGDGGFYGAWRRSETPGGGLQPAEFGPPCGNIQRLAP
jgi:hypothetical protein